MLAEFYLTPHALADDDGGNGAEFVEELERTLLFPEQNRAASVPLICGLGTKEWLQAASKKIAHISNHVHQHRAKRFLLKLERDYCLVDRPPTAVNTNEEKGWIDAGIQSASSFPLEKIIASSKPDSLPKNVFRIKDFISEEFWEAYQNPRLIGRSENEQEPVLRAVCAHSDWMIVTLPHIRGGSDDEIVTIKQILKLAKNLPQGFTKTEIKLRIQGEEGGNSANERRIKAVRRELEDYLEDNVGFHIDACDGILNREILAGKYRKTSGGAREKDPRWLITMSHVAVGSRRTVDGETNTWNLFPRKNAHMRLRSLETEKDH
jgi:hypothetical protein